MTQALLAVKSLGRVWNTKTLDLSGTSSQLYQIDIGFQDANGLTVGV